MSPSNNHRLAFPLIPFLVPILFTVVAASVTITKRAAINRDHFPDRLWPTDEPIPYRFSSDFSSDDRPGVRDVLDAIESKTCLSFEDVTKESDAQSNKSTIVFINSTYCGAQRVGRRRKPATLYINSKELECRTPYSYYEEMLRALGMYYVHTRPDRDDYISIHEEDIKPDMEAEWFRRRNALIVTSYGVPYDFSSLLHLYPDYYNNSKGMPMMVAKDPLHQPGMGLNKYEPSHSDYLLLNRLYRCLDRCSTSKVKCQNGGFLNPNNCAKCICSRGFAGRSCNEVEISGTDCGGYKAATVDWQRFQVDWSSIDEERLCYWFITVPPGQRVEIELEHIMSEDPKCPITPFTWLEIRLGNFVVGGYQFFCNAHIPNHTLTSEGSLAVITLSKDRNKSFAFELLFRNVETNSGSTGSTFAVSLVFVLSITTKMWT